MINPIILVVTATLGDRETIVRTVNSVQEIGGDDIEHVIVCPQHRITDLSDKFPHVRFIAEPKGKKGIYAALNIGFKTFGRDYEYLTFLNDDDFWLPGYKEIINTIKRNSQLELIYGRTRFVDEAGRKIKSQTSYGEFEMFGRLLKRKGIVLLTQQATLIKSSLYFRVGGFDESYKLVADTKFWLQLSLESIRYKYINNECAAYTIQENQLSSDRELQKKEHERLMLEFSNVKEASFMDVLRYRLLNINIYCSRLLRR